MESFEPFGGSDSTFISQLSPGVLIMISPEGSTLRDETLQILLCETSIYRTKKASDSLL